jgi:hypothetical protein
MIEFTLAFALGFGGGGTLIWFFKTRIQALVIDANKLSAQLHAEADAITVAIKKA